MSDSDRVLPVSPSSPDPAAGLHAELLALKQRSGLSYSRISALTHYSKSSWERWINGKQFPPRGAVESFARAARTDAGPLLGLWERAERARGATAEGDGPAPEPEPTAPEAESIAAAPDSIAADVPEPAPDAAEDQAAPATPAAAPATDTDTDTDTENPRTPGRRRAPFLIAAAVAAAAALTAAGLTISHYVSDGHGGSPAAGGRAADAAAAARTDPVGCTQAGCTGKDPGAMGCARDGQTLALDRNGDMVVELRYSRTCGAAWGRITYAKPKAVVDVNNSSGTAEATPVHWGNDVYSPMAELSGEQTAWACGTQPGGKSRTCTVHSPVPAEH
ncbi:XRE family transcriptional regulator [Streptomyces sp. SID10815]|uniref:DUF2690 domain-containing protein n=1 Tax=Streptomyces sp. SID10815 TaxID=2706027 RepID=UPI0013CAC6A4|nr:DUF2690 domain-containing protein [Streptomyces sp. SID10815]